MKNLLLALLGIALTFTAHAQPLKLGIVIDTSEPLKVSYVGEDFKRKVQIGALSGLLLTPLGGGLVAGGAVAKQNADFSERLRTSVGDSVDRYAIFEKELVEEFAKYTTDIELVFLDAELLNKGKPDFKRIDADATPYVVVLEEWAGMATPTLRWGSLAPVTNSKLRVYKAGEKKPVLKENLEGIGAFNDDKDAALDAPESFVNGYPEAVSIAAYHLYWRLNGRNVLHGLAKGTLHADKFPSIEKVLADNSKRFGLDRPKIKGWKQPRSGSPYLFRAEPKKDKRKVGILTDVDVLTRELGQDFDSLDPYLALRLTRQADLGYGVDDATDITVLEFGDEWTTYMITDPRGGYGLFLHRIDGDMVLSHQIIVLEEDPVPLLTKYKADIESYIGQMVFTVNN